MVYYCHTTVVSYHCSAHASLENQRRLHKLYRNNFINSCFGLLKYFVYDRKKWHVLPNKVQSQPYYVFLTKTANQYGIRCKTRKEHVSSVTAMPKSHKSYKSSSI